MHEKEGFWFFNNFQSFSIIIFKMIISCIFVENCAVDDCHPGELSTKQLWLLLRFIKERPVEHGRIEISKEDFQEIVFEDISFG